MSDQTHSQTETHTQIKADTVKIMTDIFNEAVSEYNQKENRKSKQGVGMADHYNQGYKSGKFELIKV